MDGPAMVLAGPGSGKTTVIIHRIKHLIESHVRPEHILVITFTRAAERQMQERFSALCKGASFPVTFGTFHSVFLKVLRNHYDLPDSALASERRKRKVLSQIVEISKVKTERIPVEYYYSSSMGEEEFRRIYAGYRREQERLRKVDFDDMSVYTSDLLRARKDILRSWQEKFRYILVDEFQDIDLIQYQIVRLLAGSGN